MKLNTTYVYSDKQIIRSKLHDEFKKTTICKEKTLLDILLEKNHLQGSEPLLGYIEEEELHYYSASEVWTKVSRLGEFLSEKVEENGLFGLYSINRPEWVISEYAGYYAKCTNVPLYSSFQAPALQLIIEETNMKVVCASAECAKKLYSDVLKQNKMGVEILILFDNDSTTIKLYSGIGVEVIYIGDLIDNHRILKGGTIGEPRRICREDDIATICYTSGTTGTPKGVMLTHKNFIASIKGVLLGAEREWLPIPKEGFCYLSYLPLAHVLERVCFSAGLSKGGRMCFYRGDKLRIMDDYKIIKPTFIVSVPRVLNLFEQRIKKSVEEKNIFIRILFFIGLHYKIFMQMFGIYSSWFWDFLVFKRIYNEFGGNLKGVLVGGASINPKCIEFMQAVLSCKIIQGYGQTEGLAANVVQTWHSTNTKTVGIPIAGVECRLLRNEDYADEKYVGELLLHGDCVMKGYFKREEENREVFVKIGGERWLRTGDIFKFEEGEFQVVGRAKELFKTSYGEYINPEKIENLLSGGLISDVFVTGTKTSDYLMAIVVVQDPDLIGDERRVLSMIKRKGDELVKEGKINKYEIPSSCYVVGTEFSELGNNLMTPTLKKKRKNLYEHFKTEIKRRL